MTLSMRGITFRMRAGVHEFERFFDINLAGHFTKAGSGDVFVTFEAVPIDLYHHIAKGVVSESEE